MKKLTTAILLVLSSSQVVAQDANISDLSSTADKPVHMFELIEGKRTITAYAGAELGGNLLLGEQINSDGEDASVDYWNMFKVGSDLKYQAYEDIAFLIGGEARFAIGGRDDFSKAGYGKEENTDVDRFIVGVESVAGTTKFGRQCGIVDAYAGFGDLSKEHGVGGKFDDIACTENMLDHQYKNDTFHVGVSYDQDVDGYGFGGSANVGPVVLGAAAAIKDAPTDAKVDKETAYTIGAVFSMDDLKLGVHGSKYTAQMTDKSADLELGGLGLGATYQVSEELSVAVTYNAEKYDNFTRENPKSKQKFDSDKWFTVGASYRVTKNLELVTDYKLGSEFDDKLFLRANVSF